MIEAELFVLKPAVPLPEQPPPITFMFNVFPPEQKNPTKLWPAPPMPHSQLRQVFSETA